MPYGLNPGLFVENGPAVQAANVAAARNHGRFRSWRRLGPANRLQVVEQAMKAPANDFIDRYPVAL